MSVFFGILAALVVLLSPALAGTLSVALIACISGSALFLYAIPTRRSYGLWIEFGFLTGSTLLLVTQNSLSPLLLGLPFVAYIALALLPERYRQLGTLCCFTWQAIATHMYFAGITPLYFLITAAVYGLWFWLLLRYQRVTVLHYAA
jgi:hypothetical protein